MCDVIHFSSIISFTKFHYAHQLHKYHLFTALMRNSSVNTLVSYSQITLPSLGKIAFSYIVPTYITLSHNAGFQSILQQIMLQRHTVGIVNDFQLYHIIFDLFWSLGSVVDQLRLLPHFRFYLQRYILMADKSVHIQQIQD